jgi:type VI secretion system secreted protein VgrG
MAELTLSFESGEDSLSVRRFSVRDALSSPFEVSVIARSPNDEIDLESIVGKKAGFLFMGGVMSAPRVYAGVCSRFELLQAEKTGLSTYLVRISPRLWLLQHRRARRIFEHMTVPDIVKKILGEHGIEPRLAIKDPHEEHEYRVQYGETDLGFVSRLLEEEGISYAFEPVPEGEGFTSRLVLDDSPESRAPRGQPIRYVDQPSQAARQVFVTSVRLTQRVRAGKYTIRDYDFMRPDRTLEGKATPAPAPEDFYEQYHFAPAAYIKDRKGTPRTVADAEANRRAEIALAAKRADRREVAFHTNAHDLGAGAVFGIERHPRKELAPDKRLLVLETVLDGSHDGEWVTWARAVFAAARYRPPQRAEKPVVAGQESAIVVGKQGEEIHTDEQGRVRVQFHWDRDGKYDEKASCWVRVSQGWAGAAWGEILLPRVGHEVLVDFFDGDPDHPVVVGRVFNARTKVPYKLPAEKTRSTWKSDSSPHADGFNEIMFEDKAGAELVYVQAQRNLSKLVKEDEIERTGRSRLAVVGKDRTTIVATSDSEMIGEKRTIATISPKDLKILTLDDPDVTILETVIEAIDEKIATTTGKATITLQGADIVLTSGGKTVIKSGGDVILEGAHVYLNTQSVGMQKLKAQADLADKAARPKGRTLGAIKKAFSAAEAAPDDGGGAPAEKKDLVVPHRVQVGGTCGIAALGMVLDYWNTKDGALSHPPDTKILEDAVSRGWSKTGETSPQVRADLAKLYGYDATYMFNATIADLKKALAEGVPLIIGFNVDKGAGNPQWTDLNRAHAAVVKGFVTRDGKEYIVAQHGWPNAANKEWLVEDFQKSWDTRDNSMGLVKPKAKKP